MSKSDDNQPMAPRRSLKGSGQVGADERTQKVPTQSRSKKSGSSAPSGPPGPSSQRQQTQQSGQQQASTQQKTDDKAAQAAEREKSRKEKDEAARQRREEKAAQRASKKQPRQIRRAKLRVSRVDPWSVTKTAFLLSIAFGIMCVVAVFLIFSIMNAAGLWDSINAAIGKVLGPQKGTFDINDYVGMDRIMGVTVLIAVVDVVILTALATLASFIYNMSAAVLGGIEVTLAEDLN